MPSSDPAHSRSEHFNLEPSKEARSSMKRSAATMLLALFAWSLAAPTGAQTMEGAMRVARGPGLGTNYAPRPGLYTVVLVDVKGGRLRVRDVEGKTLDANVAKGAYDLSKLKIGDKVRIDFVAQDTPEKKPTAATIWPAH
jgi:phosphoribosylformylglycinamidine (FGAM) synthase PurS component